MPFHNNLLSGISDIGSNIMDWGRETVGNIYDTATDWLGNENDLNTSLIPGAFPIPGLNPPQPPERISTSIDSDEEFYKPDINYKDSDIDSDIKGSGPLLNIIARNEELSTIKDESRDDRLSIINDPNLSDIEKAQKLQALDGMQINLLNNQKLAEGDIAGWERDKDKKIGAALSKGGQSLMDFAQGEGNAFEEPFQYSRQKGIRRYR